MKKSILSLTALSLVFLSCNTKPDPYLIQKNSIGSLNSTSQIKDLNTIFKNDSVVQFKPGTKFTGNINDIEVYEKGGKKLLTLSTNNIQDSTAVINSVQVLDPRFKTATEVSILSTFKDIQDHYKISRIDNLINAIVVSVDELNASFTIDKMELPSNLRFDMTLHIEASQIPDNANIKYFFLNW